MFRLRWAGNSDFQRIRGVLRILTSIVSDLLKRQDYSTGANGLIHTSNVNFLTMDALSGQLRKLYGNGYESAIAADVAGNASNNFKIDGQKPEFQKFGATRGVAATILLGSFGGAGINKGIGIDEIKPAGLASYQAEHEHPYQSGQARCEPRGGKGRNCFLIEREDGEYRLVHCPGRSFRGYS